jgi:hypothetical protein
MSTKTEHEGYKGHGYKVQNSMLPPRSDGRPRREGGKVFPVRYTDSESVKGLCTPEEFKERYKLPADDDASDHVSVSSAYGTGERRVTLSEPETDDPSKDNNGIVSVR